nr:alanine racemase C-terminal domain-containing protein [Microbacterium endophyticum]
MTALVENARLIVEEVGTDLVLDLRANAWGFGADRVASVLRDVGLEASRFTGAPHPGLTERLYGLGDERSASVLSLHGTVLSVKPLLRGEGVSYGFRHRASTDTNVALVTGGYAQGIVRALGNQAYVTVAGARCPIVGRVAMDVSVIDVSHHPVRRGDTVVYLGDSALGETSLRDWCAMTGLNVREIVAGILTRARTEHHS